MKILHTADWHAGRTLRGVPRTAEIREVLQEIAELAKSEAVDLILVAGDLFDTRNPGADAEAAVYEFFVTTGRAGIPSVVIAGNHDSPSRIDASSSLLSLTNTHAFGEVRVAGQGGAFSLQIGDEVAQIAALPFISERRIVKVAELLEEDPGKWRERYQEGMRKLIGNLTKPFRPDAVNLLVTHTTMNGATLSNSEYKFHSTENYSLSSDLFPERCNYVALGHIHKTQAIEGYPENAGRYSGSILQLDFGEQGDTKYVYIVEAKAGKPTTLVKQHEIQAGKRLRRVKVALDELDRRTAELAEFDGWLKVSVALEQPLPGLKDRIRRHLPNALAIDLDLPGQQEKVRQGVDLEKISMSEAYAQFYEETRGQGLPDALKTAFNTLYEASDAKDESSEVVAGTT